MIPIPKINKPIDYKNLRPISLLHIFSINSDGFAASSPC